MERRERAAPADAAGQQRSSTIPSDVKVPRREVAGAPEVPRREPRLSIDPTIEASRVAPKRIAKEALVAGVALSALLSFIVLFMFTTCVP